MGTSIRLYELIFHTHITENNTSTFYFIKEINFIEYNWRKSRLKILGLQIKLIVGAKILKHNFLPIFLIKLIFFFYKTYVFPFFLLYLCVKNKLIWKYLSAQTWILIGCFCLKQYLKMPKANFFWSKWLRGWNNRRRDVCGKFEMRGGHDDQNCEKHLKIYKVVTQQTYPLKT